MKKQYVMARAAEALQAAGFQAGQYQWLANRLVVSVAGQVRVLDLKGGMSRAALERTLGRLEGWGDLLRAA